MSSSLGTYLKVPREVGEFDAMSQQPVPQFHLDRLRKTFLCCDVQLTLATSCVCHPVLSELANDVPLFLCYDTRTAPACTEFPFNSSTCSYLCSFYLVLHIYKKLAYCGNSNDLIIFLVFLTRPLNIYRYTVLAMTGTSSTNHINRSFSFHPIEVGLGVEKLCCQGNAARATNGAIE